jgi:periplasmic protein TonB
MRGDVNSSDRLLTTLVLASIAHAVVILGVHFRLPEPVQIKRSLDITLVRSPSRQAPEHADVLAQENQFGSGEEPKETVPKTAPVEIAGTGKKLAPIPEAAEREPEVKPRRLLTRARSEKAVVQDEGEAEQREAERPHLDAGILSQQIAEFSAELSKAQEDQAKRPRLVRINSVNAHKYKAAAYEKDWQEKVERIGNLNYPDDARRKNLSGALLLAVGIKPDGSVYSVQVRSSSGEPVLDDAATRIVRLAAPFAPFPEELKREADVLVITRTWKFFNDNRVETSP